MKVFTLFFLFSLLVNYQVYSQIIDIDNRNFHYSLKNLDVFGFKKELNQTLNIFNHGIFHNKNKRDDYKTAGGFSSTIWIENENVGRLPNIGDNEKIFIKPLFVESKLSKKGVRGFTRTGQINDVIINKIALEIYEFLTTELNISNLIEINEVDKIGDLEIPKGIFRRGLLERSERLLNNEIKVSSEDFYIVPIFIQLEENKNNYLHVELQFFSNYKLLFKTSVSVFFNPSNFDELRLINSKHIQKEIVASLFHQLQY